MKRGDREVTQYYHEGVVFYRITDSLAVPLDVEMMRPREGEVAAALRLLERVFRNHGRRIDGVIGDAEYLCAPFFNFCTEHRKYAAAVLKENNPALLAEAQALMAQIRPTVEDGPLGRSTFWDVEGITVNDQMIQPVRVLRALEPARATRRLPAGPDGPKQPEPHDNYWATTAPQSVLPTRALAQVGHHRWDIENRVFNILVNHWGLDHCYKHHPTAILNFLLTLFLAYLLIQAFYHRNLKPEVRRLFQTLISLADELYAGLAGAGRSRAPWIERATLRAP